MPKHSEHPTISSLLILLGRIASTNSWPVRRASNHHTYIVMETPCMLLPAMRGGCVRGSTFVPHGMTCMPTAHCPAFFFRVLRAWNGKGGRVGRAIDRLFRVPEGVAHETRVAMQSETQYMWIGVGERSEFACQRRYRILHLSIPHT